MDQVASIIDAVAQAGGDFIRIDNLRFSVEDPSVYYEEAREKAIAVKLRAVIGEACVSYIKDSPTDKRYGCMCVNMHWARADSARGNWGARGSYIFFLTSLNMKAPPLPCG